MLKHSKRTRAICLGPLTLAVWGGLAVCGTALADKPGADGHNHGGDDGGDDGGDGYPDGGTVEVFKDGVSLVRQRWISSRFL